MKTLDLYSRVSLLVVVLVATLFLAAAISKMLHLSDFLDTVKQYSFVPAEIAKYLAFLIILLELWLSPGLIIPATRKHASIALIFLNTIFTLVVVNEILSGNHHACGCYLPLLEKQINWMKVLHNLALLLALLHIYNFSRKV